MKSKNGQVSLEYMIITGFVVFAIIIPAFILLFYTTNRSVYGTVNTQMVSDLGNGLVNDAKQMYYLGLYSNKVSEYEVPKNVEYFYIVEIEQEGLKYYYLGVTLTDSKTRKSFFYLSDVPITSDDNNPNVVKGAPLEGLISECESSICEFYSFEGPAKLQGRKKFKIETTYDDEEDMVKASITPVI